MPTVWIRRNCASDILVRFPSWRVLEAHDFANLIPGNVSVYPEEDFHPNQVKPTHMISWNLRGFIEVAQDVARDLGSRGEPGGFVPYSMQEVWRQCKKTEAELDAELDEYFSS
jgi:hypothetical protein